MTREAVADLFVLVIRRWAAQDPKGTVRRSEFDALRSELAAGDSAISLRISADHDLHKAELQISRVLGRDGVAIAGDLALRVTMSELATGDDPRRV